MIAPRTHIEGRKIAIVGRPDEAHRFCVDHNIDGTVPVVTQSATLLNYPAAEYHIIILPSFWNLAGHIFIYAALRRLDVLGASLEWV